MTKYKYVKGKQISYQAYQAVQTSSLIGVEKLQQNLLAACQ